MAGGSKLDKTAASRLVSGNIWTRNSSTPASGITNATGGAPPRRRGPGFILRPKPKTVSIGERLANYQTFQPIRNYYKVISYFKSTV